MRELISFLQALGGMPLVALVAIVLLGGFALAAYAIYAVLNVTKERR